MAIKNILIAYNGGEASDAALRLALQMAEKHDAHLTGIVAHGASSVTRNIPRWLSESMRASIAEITVRRTDELAGKFADRTRGKTNRPVSALQVGGPKHLFHHLAADLRRFSWRGEGLALCTPLRWRDG